MEQHEFTKICADVKAYQLQNNKIFKNWVNHTQNKDIAFLPIRFFKSHKIVSGTYIIQKVFESSGTTGSQTSKHFVADLAWYNAMAKLNFEAKYGSLSQYTIFALLPSYLERDNSSLVHMTSYFMEQAKGDFYLHNWDQLLLNLKLAMDNNEHIILLGVSYALLDFAKMYTLPSYKNLIIMETGGMKGNRPEMVKEMLHTSLINEFKTETIHAEYGMTEMLSQAYSFGNGLFYPSISMQIVITHLNDPFQVLNPKQRGRINVIDLANVDSCSFIATDDLGYVNEDGSFCILGRIENADLRGCNLLYV